MSTTTKLGIANTHTFAATENQPENSIYNIKIFSDGLNALLQNNFFSPEQEQANNKEFLKLYVQSDNYFKNKQEIFSIRTVPSQKTKLALDLNIKALTNLNKLGNKESFYLTAAKSATKENYSVYQHKKNEKNVYVGYGYEKVKKQNIIGSAFRNKTKQGGYEYTALMVNSHKFLEAKKEIKNDGFFNAYVNIFIPNSEDKPLYITLDNAPSKNAEFSVQLNKKGIEMIENSPDINTYIFISPKQEKSISPEFLHSDLNVFINPENQKTYLGTGWTKEQLNKEYVFEQVISISDEKNIKEGSKQNIYETGQIISFPANENKLLDSALSNGLITEKEKLIHGTITDIEKNTLFVKTPAGNLRIDTDKTNISNSTTSALKDFNTFYNSLKTELKNNSQKKNKTVKSAKTAKTSKQKTNTKSKQNEISM